MTTSFEIKDFRGVKSEESQTEALERYFNELPSLIDPCKLCRHKEEDTGHDITVCPKCCYYHPSLFEISKEHIIP